MNCIIPFTKDIKFKTNISEILSISLEHDYTLNDSDLLGNFLISGEYKAHEVSVNKEKFEFSLPFSVALASRLDPDSLDFNIEDFTYEVIDNNTLRVDIEYSLKAKELPKEEEKETLERVDIDDEKVEELLEELPKEVQEKEEIRRVEENIVEVKEKEEVKEIPKNEDAEEVARDINSEDKETILNNINVEDNSFVTYHIHVYKENETIETICAKYNTTSNTLGEYNDLSNLTIGDKIIIPDLVE